jgi:putative transposase
LSGWPTSPKVWEQKYPGIVRLWENAWAEFVPFLSFDQEVRQVIYTTKRNRD